MKLVSIAALFVASFTLEAHALPLPSPLDARLEQIQAGCKTAPFEGVVACPQVSQYEMPARHDEYDYHALIHDLYYDFTFDKTLPADEAAEFLLSGLKLQVQMAKQYAEMNPKVRKGLVEMMASVKATDTSIRKLLRDAQSEGAELLVSRTYWAPSVNARGIAIVNRNRGTVTVLLHGETDG